MAISCSSYILKENRLRILYFRIKKLLNQQLAGIDVYQKSLYRKMRLQIFMLKIAILRRVLSYLKIY